MFARIAALFTATESVKAEAYARKVEYYRTAGGTMPRTFFGYTRTASGEWVAYTGE